MTKNIDLSLLRAFLTVQDCGGFLAAGKRLGRTQPAVSLQIQRLETLLGKQVFERTSRSLRLSATGELLVPYAQKILDMNDEAVMRLEDETVAGVLRIGAPEAMASTHLPKILSLFSRAHPAILLNVTCGLTEDLLQQYEEDLHDVIIFKKDAARKNTGESIHTERLAWASSADLLKKPDGDIPVILSPAPCVYRTLTIEALEKSRRSWRAVITTHSLAGRIGAVQAGLGVALMSYDLLGPQMVAAPKNWKLPDPGKLDLGILAEKTGRNIIIDQFCRSVRDYFANK